LSILKARPVVSGVDVIAAQETQRLTADRKGATRRPAEAKLKVRRFIPCQFSGIARRSRL
jgi:hypothetical protein